ncbi:MAG TPA: hypothetical protein VGN63_02070 [Flavisolibacter sp.]|jgi:hypothetical protein|nr:hypothetical protein [Flavisolibacter sp.]
MKTLTISAVLLLAAIVTSSFVLSHQAVAKESVNSVQNVTSLRAHRQGKNIALTWSAAGAGLAAFHVERSYDGEFFEVIGTVENTGARSYKFLDDFAPGYIYYRICCTDADGEELSKSTVEVVRIVQRK